MARQLPRPTLNTALLNATIRIRFQMQFGDAPWLRNMPLSNSPPKNPLSYIFQLCSNRRMIDSFLPTRYRHPVLDTGFRFSELIALVSGTSHQVRGDELGFGFVPRSAFNSYRHRRLKLTTWTATPPFKRELCQFKQVKSGN